MSTPKSKTGSNKSKAQHKQEAELRVKVKPVKYDPKSDKPPKCFKNWIDGNKFCITCRYHRDCKKKDK